VLGLGATAASAFPVELQLATGPLALKLPLIALPHCDATAKEAYSSLVAQFARASLLAVDPTASDAVVVLDRKQFSVAQSFITHGLAMAPGVLSSSIESAVAERRGYWRCAPVTVLFHTAQTINDAQVLAAIALKESELDSGVAWPWTINSRGKSLYFASRSKAIDAAKRLLAAGDDLFDVGLMQINWRYHKTRFPSLEAAFSPLANIRAADAILNEEYRRTGDMRKAIARYHSPGNVQRGQAYAAGVMEKLAKVIREVAQHNVRSQEGHSQ
jgi:hypothetical protein